MSIEMTIKERALSLRLQGKSYNQILKELDLPSKGTLSYWFKDLPLPPESQKLLAKNVEIATKRGLISFNRKRSASIKSENEAMAKRGKSEIGKLNKRELALLGAALYWGEGTKAVRKHGSAALVFTNSDPEMIRVFLNFLRQIFQVPEERIRAGIHLYSEAKTDAARVYWSKVTHLPKDRFYTSLLVSGASSRKRGNTLPYGTLAIRVNDRKTFYRMKGMIEGLKD